MSFPEDPEYPADRFHGDKGEVSAVFRPADTPADISSPGGPRPTTWPPTKSTGGEFGLYKVESGARFAGARTHHDSYFVEDAEPGGTRSPAPDIGR
ncbi:hypothetical protein ABZT17_03795 [Streptomyces sp. NPDC005648]|uniref:hypothetical protein n=1 Tax=Streptomyces sp. NPDC005648 TaxID=3157044 RepID=UPI0033A7A657